MSLRRKKSPVFLPSPSLPIHRNMPQNQIMVSSQPPVMSTTAVEKSDLSFPRRVCESKLGYLLFLYLFPQRGWRNKMEEDILQAYRCSINYTFRKKFFKTFCNFYLQCCALHTNPSLSSLGVLHPRAPCSTIRATMECSIAGIQLMHQNKATERHRLTQTRVIVICSARNIKIQLSYNIRYLPCDT